MDLPDTLTDDLYDFAFCPESCYERLVDLASPEPWGEGNRVLKNGSSVVSVGEIPA